MEYFTLTSQEGNPIPRIVNWYGKIDVRKLNRQDYKQIPRLLLLDMQNGTDLLFPDILTEPFFMVSREAMEVIRMYEENMPFLFIALFDAQNDESASYYCPILEVDNEEAAIYKKKTINKSVIKIRLDLAESLLQRKAVGLSLIKE